MRKLLTACIAAMALLALTASAASAEGVFNTTTGTYCPTGPTDTSGCVVGIHMGDQGADPFDIDMHAFGFASNYLTCSHSGTLRMYIETSGQFRLGDTSIPPHCNSGSQTGTACNNQPWHGHITEVAPSVWEGELELCIQRGGFNTPLAATATFDVADDGNGNLLFEADRHTMTDSNQHPMVSHSFQGSMREYSPVQMINGFNSIDNVELIPYDN